MDSKESNKAMLNTPSSVQISVLGVQQCPLGSFLLLLSISQYNNSIITLKKSYVSSNRPSDPTKRTVHPEFRNINFIKIYETLTIYNWESHSMGDSYNYCYEQ